MFQKMSPATQLTASLSLMLIIGISLVWASDYYSNSVVVPRGKKGNSSMTVVKNGGKDKVEVLIRKHTLEPYMDEMGVDEVEVTVDAVVDHVTGGAASYYAFDFTFGPAGAYFEPKLLELIFKGQYASERTEVWLYDENGEAVEGIRNDNADHTVFYIPHFSSYTYDNYDEY